MCLAFLCTISKEGSWRIQVFYSISLASSVYEDGVPLTMQSGSGVMSTLLWRTAASAAATRASSIQYGRIMFVWFLELWMFCERVIRTGRRRRRRRRLGMRKNYIPCLEIIILSCSHCDKKSVMSLKTSRPTTFAYFNLSCIASQTWHELEGIRENMRSQTGQMLRNRSACWFHVTKLGTLDLDLFSFRPEILTGHRTNEMSKCRTTVGASSTISLFGDHEITPSYPSWKPGHKMGALFFLCFFTFFFFFGDCFCVLECFCAFVFSGEKNKREESEEPRWPLQGPPHETGIN